jgi:hypothetical protein
MPDMDESRFNVRYDAKSLRSETQATWYFGTRHVVLPGGLKLICASAEQAMALRAMLNVLVIEQTTDEVE